jgi:protein-disulfide isomerase/uncharacterized membrane protein
MTQPFNAVETMPRAGGSPGDSPGNDADEPRWLSVGRRAVLASLAALALGLACYLSWVALSGGSVAGCGGDVVDCDTVLSTRWNQWFGVSVALLAVGVYGSLFVSVWFLAPAVPAPVRRGAWMVTLALAAAAGGAALWFSGLQLLAIGKFCVPCLATHACGLTLAALVWRWGALGQRAGRVSRSSLAIAGGVGGALIALLAGGQAAYQSPQFRIDRSDDSVAQAKPSSSAATQGAAAGGSSTAATTTVNKPPLSRILKFHKLSKPIDVYEEPILGSPDAEHVVVKLFDYSCPHCREQHFQLEEARKHFGNRLAIVVLPVPLNHSCNRYAPAPQSNDAPNALACVYARTAIAVWATDRTKFAEFHHWMFVPETPPTADAVREYVTKLIGGPLNDDWRQSERLSRYVELYGEAGGGKLPKLIAERMTINGSVRDANELIATLEKEWAK